MIKATVLTFLLLFSVQIIFAQKCVERSVGNERRFCSHMIVEIEGFETAELKGIIIDSNEDPIPESVIEVYEAKEDGRLIATYKTGGDGKFCIKDLPTGRYLIRAGYSGKGFNCTNIEVQIKGKKKRFVKIPLEVGT